MGYNLDDQPLLPQPSVASKVVADVYQWPVLFAVLPPLLTLYYGGRIEEWAEGFTLLVIAFYLYGLIKLPWELYVTARLRNHSLNRVARAYTLAQESSVADKHDKSSSNNDDEAERIRSASLRKLAFLEWLYFLLVFASPLTGAIFLRYMRPHLLVYRHLITDFPMSLYVLTAYIRPLTHLSRLLKQHAAQLQTEVSYPNLEVDQLRQRISDLEDRLDQLQSGLSSTREEADKRVQNMFSSQVEPTLKVLNKDLKRTVKKEQRFVQFSEERFRDLESRLLEQDRIIHLLSEQQHHGGGLLAPVYWAVDLAPAVLNACLVVPMSLGWRVATWWVPSSVKRLLITDSKKRPSIDYQPGSRSGLTSPVSGSHTSLKHHHPNHGQEGSAVPLSPVTPRRSKRANGTGTSNSTSDL